ncbi:lamin tail domain-containing protein (plasmid) [Streptomyces goshikiensis]|uniref:Lamin tail domain-containing protein n=1 Tax=Streptomyces goshikiensis TaxID=1942 RepID=A0ABZ1RWP1_9ACTN|nr:lamin tail domain-containing protein [Streptomyces goshikiensis]
MSASLTTRRALAAVLAAGALIGAAAMPAAADGHGHGRDNGRNHGRDHVRDHDHGRDNGRDNGRDQGRGRDHGRDNGRDNGRDHRAPSSIAIGEVQNEDGMRGDRFGRALNREWVEVKNTGRHAVNLRGYTLTDEQGNRYRFPDFRLDGRSSVKVHTGQGRNTRHDLYQDRRRQVWDDSDTATLRDDRGNIIDTESWGRRGHHHRNG